VLARPSSLPWNELSHVADASGATLDFGFLSYKQHLRRLALHDDALLEAIAAEGSSFPASVIDEKSAALARVAATIAVDAALASFQSAVALALTARATNDEVVATLESVTPVMGAARVVQCTPKLALALATTSTPRSNVSTDDVFAQRRRQPRYTEPRYRFDRCKAPRLGRL
jgi:hypothetical protein